MLFQRHELLTAGIVAEAIGLGLKHRKAMRIGMLFGCVRAAGCEANGDVMPRILRGLFNGCRPTKDDQVSERDFLAASVEFGLDRFKRCNRFGQFGRLIDSPILLRCQTNACAIGTAPLIRSTEG